MGYLLQASTHENPAFFLFCFFFLLQGCLVPGWEDAVGHNIISKLIQATKFLTGKVALGGNLPRQTHLAAVKASHLSTPALAACGRSCFLRASLVAGMGEELSSVGPLFAFRG